MPASDTNYYKELRNVHFLTSSLRFINRKINDRFHSTPRANKAKALLNMNVVFAPTRVQHGKSNEIIHFQNFLLHVLDNPPFERSLPWIGDLVHRDFTVHDLLEPIAFFCVVCMRYNV